NKSKAKSVLDKVMEMIPDEPRYDYGLSTERIAQAYYKAGDAKKAKELLNTTRQRLIEKIDFYESLPPNLRYTVSRDLRDTRSDYSLLVYGEVGRFLNKGDTGNALKLFQSEFSPVKTKLVQSYQEYMKDGNLDRREEANIDGQFRFVSELLGIAELIDSAYAEKETNDLYKMLTK